MKIGLIANTFSVERGTGIARYSHELLSGFNKKGLYAHPIFTNPPKGPYGWTVNHAFKLPYRVLQEANNFDLLHATSPAAAFSFPLVKKAASNEFKDVISHFIISHKQAP